MTKQNPSDCIIQSSHRFGPPASSLSSESSLGYGLRSDTASLALRLPLIGAALALAPHQQNWIQENLATPRWSKLAGLIESVWWGISSWFIITILLYMAYCVIMKNPCSWCFIMIFLRHLANSWDTENFIIRAPLHSLPIEASLTSWLCFFEQVVISCLK